jgi:hypothetical protein
MAFVHGKNTKVLVDQFDMSAYLNNTDQSWEVDVPESTVYGLNDRTYIAGLRTMTLSMSGFWDQASSATPEPVLPNRLGQAGTVLLTYAPTGLTTSKPAYSMQCRVSNYTVASPVDGIVTINLDVQGTGKLSRGVVLHNLVAETSTATAEEPYEYDSRAAASTGTHRTTVRCNAYLHITTSNQSALACKIQHSSDSTSWTDLKSFTAANGVSAERITTSATLKRYVRCFWTLSSAGSAKFTITFDDSTSGL